MQIMAGIEHARVFDPKEEFALKESKSLGVTEPEPVQV